MVIFDQYERETTFLVILWSPVIPRFFLLRVSFCLTLCWPFTLIHGCQWLVTQVFVWWWRNCFFRRMYLLISLIGIIWYTFFQDFMSSASSERNYVIVHYIILKLDKWVICCAYNEPGPPRVAGGTVTYKVTVCKEVSSIPLEFFYDRLPRLQLYFYNYVLLPMVFSGARLEVPPCF